MTAQVPLFAGFDRSHVSPCHFTLFRVEWTQGGHKNAKGMAKSEQQSVAGKGRHTLRRWTATQVAALPPRSSPYTDPGQVGLQMLVRERQNAAPSRTWLLRFKWRGEESRMLLGHFPEISLDEARGLARKYRESADQGIDPRRARPKRNPKATPLPLSAATARAGDKHSIEFLVSEFMERHVKPTRKRPEYAQRILNTDVLPEWRGRDARTIQPHEVIALLDKIVDRGSKVLANRAAGLLGQMFKFGIHRQIVSTTPVQLLYRPGGKEKPRERSLNDGELAAFLTHLDDVCRSPRIAHVLRLLLLTGQRRSEIALARWMNIDMKEKTWTIPDVDAKAGRGHVVPLSDWAVKEFEALKRLAPNSRFVFPDDEGSQPANPKLITRSVARCQTTWKKKGVAAFTPHDLRRTCRTGLSKLKIAPHIAERVLNHAQDKIAGTYDVHQYMEEKREALERWAKHLESLTMPEHSRFKGVSA